MDEMSSWLWQAPNISRFLQTQYGIVMFSDGGYRPKERRAAAGWVIVAVVEDGHDDSEEVSKGGSRCVNMRNNVKNSLGAGIAGLRAVKVAEGARFLPACRSSFEAELIAVSDLIKHFNSLVDLDTPMLDSLTLSWGRDA
jgi:hypothetical protein